MNALARFEGFMQELMDRRVVRLLGGSLQPVELARRIGRCMEANQAPSPAGVNVPNRFELLVHPEDYADLRALDPELERKLEEYAVEFARERGFNFQGAPRVRLAAGSESERGIVRVEGAVETPKPPPAQRFQTRRRYSYDAPRPVLAGLWLEVPQPDGTPSRLPVQRFPFAIGRREGNDLVLPDSRVSRQHAVIEQAGGGYRVRDAGSRNGTRLNGERVSEADLRDGDLLAIGGFEVLVRISSGRS